MSSPDSLLFHCVFLSMFTHPVKVLLEWLDDGYGFPLGIHLEMQIASSESHTPCQTPARAPFADNEFLKYNI